MGTARAASWTRLTPRTMGLQRRHGLERVFDHCELNHVHSEWIAEFWNASSSLSFVVVGVLMIVLHRRAFLEKRYFALSVGYILCGITGVVAHASLALVMVKMDH